MLSFLLHGSCVLCLCKHVVDFTICINYMLRWFMLPVGNFMLTLQHPLFSVHKAWQSHYQCWRNVWMTFNFFLMTFLQRLVQEIMPKTASTIQQTTLRGRKQIFIEKWGFAKLHIAVINQPLHTCPVWIISQLSVLPSPCFLCFKSWSTSN